MKIKNVSEEDLAAWRASPVAVAVLECLQKLHDTQKQMCLEAYWAGSPWPESHVESLKYQGDFIAEVFGATKEDMMAVMEQIDAESIRVVPD